MYLYLLGYNTVHTDFTRGTDGAATAPSESVVISSEDNTVFLEQ